MNCSKQGTRRSDAGSCLQKLHQSGRRDLFAAWLNGGRSPCVAMANQSGAEDNSGTGMGSRRELKNIENGNLAVADRL